MKIIGYASDKVPFSRVLENPLWKDLLAPAGPWCYTDGLVEGKKCTIVLQKVAEKEVSTLKDVGEFKKLSEDLYYFPPKELPTVEDLAKSNIPHDTEDYTTSTGVTLSIPTYRSIPKLLNSRTIMGEAIGTFAKRSELIFEKLEKKEEILDKQIIELIYGAIEECYRVTDDLLDQLGWVSTKDIDPILEIVLGIEKKTEEKNK